MTRLRFGMTHAFAAAEGWLALHDRMKDDPERALVAVVEPIAYMALDSLREPARPFTADRAKYDLAEFAAALEAQDEPKAVAMARGALDGGQRLRRAGARPDGRRPPPLRRFRPSADLCRPCRSVGRRGWARRWKSRWCWPSSARWSIRPREDLIPEFRHYGKALERWPQHPANGLAPPPGAFPRPLGQ